MEKTKLCPYCGEHVAFTLLQCPVCGESLAQAVAQTEGEQPATGTPVMEQPVMEQPAEVVAPQTPVQPSTPEVASQPVAQPIVPQPPVVQPQQPVVQPQAPAEPITPPVQQPYYQPQQTSYYQQPTDYGSFESKAQPPVQQTKSDNSTTTGLLWAFVGLLTIILVGLLFFLVKGGQTEPRTPQVDTIEVVDTVTPID